MEIASIKKPITPILRHYGVKKASVFGSFSRGDGKPDSDIDMLITIGKPMSLLSYMRLKSELEVALGRNIDLVTDKSLNRFIAPHINADLKAVYEE